MERNTTAYQLNILRDTQMVQRRLLEKQFPYIDWARMPFSSYGDFFRLRGILDDCGAVWTNAYGRSNEEADSTRKYLKDYSGNGRDIELFNFGYSRQSGYNGYVQDFRKFEAISGITATITESSIKVTNTAESGTWIIGTAISNYTNKEWRLYVEKEDEKTNVSIQFYETGNINIMSVTLQSGLNIIPVQSFTTQTRVVFSIPTGATFTFTQVPEYRGAIVGDGVDDYGQCVKDFALPDDYTVVAMREHISNTGDNSLISKTASVGNGAFSFENINGPYHTAYSYGASNAVSFPKLFSYQTKASYNNTTLSVGSGSETEESKLCLFKVRGASASCMSAALYSLGVFTRTLTEDELRIVENCMYAEWIAMTGKLEDIEYYDILDARFRSNDEDADKRNKWVGRLGKLHMTLNNYAYSGMSGWNGYPGDFSTFTKNSDGTLVSKSQSKVTLKWDSDAWVGMIPYSSFPQGKYAVRVSFSNPNMQSALFIHYNTETSSTVANTQLTSGINVIDKALSSQPNYVYVSSAEAQPGDEITIELLPDYGGALVSDGVDDYAVSDEVIDEEIGGVVAYTGFIGSSSSAYTYCLFSAGGIQNNRIYITTAPSGNIYIGEPQERINSSFPLIATLSREPVATDAALYIGGTQNTRSKSALYQLRLIKTQPTDVQLEAIKWQCRKEHDDYLIHMGWKEIE